MAKKVPESATPADAGCQYVAQLAVGAPFVPAPVAAVELYPDSQDSRAAFIAAAFKRWPRLDVAADGTITAIKHNPT